MQLFRNEKASRARYEASYVAKIILESVNPIELEFVCFSVFIEKMKGGMHPPYTSLVDSREDYYTRLKLSTSVMNTLYCFVSLILFLFQLFSFFFFVLTSLFSPFFSPTFSAYLWMRCEWASDTNCEQLFRDEGVSGRGGPNYGVGPEWIRFSLLCRQSTFDFLMERMKRVLFTPPIPQMGLKNIGDKVACVGGKEGANFGLP